MWYTYTTKLCVTIKKNEIAVFAGNWMEEENILFQEGLEKQNISTHVWKLSLKLYIFICMKKQHRPRDNL